MITVQGVAINSKSANGPISTKGDPFLPMAVNVSGKKDQPKWESLRIFSRERSELERLQEVVAERKSLIVRSVADMFASAYEKDGQPRASVSFSANLRQVEAFDNEAREWVKLSTLVGAEGAGAPAAVTAGEEASEEFPAEEELPF